MTHPHVTWFVKTYCIFYTRLLLELPPLMGNISAVVNTYEYVSSGNVVLILQPIAFGVSFLQSPISIDDPVLYTSFLDGYCSTLQGLLDWFEVDLGFTELSFIQIDLCVVRVFVLYTSFTTSL